MRLLPPGDGGLRRAAGVLLLIALVPVPGRVSRADQAGSRDRPGVADLQVASVEYDGTEARVILSNIGEATSAPTRLRLTEQPPLVARNDGSPHYPRHRFLAGERAVVIWPEPHENFTLIRVRWQGRSERDRFSGRLRVEGPAGEALAPLSLDVRGSLSGNELVREDGWVAWDATTGRPESGFDFRLGETPAPASLVLDDLLVCGALNLRQVFVGSWWITRYLRDEEGVDARGGRISIPLDDPRLRAAWTPTEGTAGAWREVDIESLSPGASVTVSVPFPAAGGTLFATVDPDDVVVEIREGNNTGHWREPGHAAVVGLHTHASFSEGTASFDRQMDLMTRSGYDAVFWTEHDWRIDGTIFPDRFDFPESLETWSLVPRRIDPELEATAGPTTERASSGQTSLRLQARRSEPVPLGAPRAVASWGFRAPRGVHIRSLAQELSLAFDLFPEPDGRFGSEFTIDLQLSDQARAQRWLTYRIEVAPDAPSLPQVVLPPPPAAAQASSTLVRPGRWTRIVVPVSQHARVLFPEGVDNNLSGIEFGLGMWSGGAVWDVDALELETAIQGDALLALQEDWAEAYPAVASHVISEISFYIPHFVPYTRASFRLDYDQVDENGYIEAARTGTRTRSGALSLAHPLGFGLPYGARHVEDQIRLRLFGADLLEAGYRYRGTFDLDAHLAFWDRALAAGATAAGVGVTDAHGPGRGNGFARDENNFVTWLDADPADAGALIDELLAGRTLFGDPLLFDGKLELDVDGGFGPGDVVMGSPGAAEVRFGGSRLPGGARVELIVDGQVAATAVGSPDAAGSHALSPGTRAVRVQAWDRRGEPLAFTSAVLFVDSIPPEGLLSSRLRGKVGERTVTGSGGFRVRNVIDQGGNGLRIGGREGSGELSIVGGFAPPTRVVSPESGVRVPYTYDPSTSILQVPLRSPGVEIEWTPPAPPKSITEVLRDRWWIGALALLGLAVLLFGLFGRRRAARRR